MKPQRLIANAKPDGSPDRAERAILRVLLGLFCPIQATVVVGEPLCGARIPC